MNKKKKERKKKKEEEEKKELWEKYKSQMADDILHRIRLEVRYDLEFYNRNL